MPSARISSLCLPLVAAALLAGCVKYTEQWEINEAGGGSVRITCEPTAAWKRQFGQKNWKQTAALFLPSYQALSQECVAAGVRLNRCRYETRFGRPRVELAIAFDTIARLERMAFFRDRILACQLNGGILLFLHRLRTAPAASWAAGDDLTSSANLADGLVEWRVKFPGRVLKASGADASGSVITARRSLREALSGRDIMFTATARTRPLMPWWVDLLLVLLALIVLAFGIRWIASRRSGSRSWSFRSRWPALRGQIPDGKSQMTNDQ